MSNEINVTLFHPATSKTDAISILPSATVADLSSFACALLNLGGDVVLAKGQSPIYNPNGGGADGSKTLAACGVGDGEFISVLTLREFESATARSPARQRPRTNGAAAAASASRNAGGGGGLDFSALLGAGAAAPPRPAANAALGGGGMDFSALLSGGAAAATHSASAPAASQQPIQWDGMNLDEAIARNSNPVHLMAILSDTARHPNLLKELNFHNPQICKKLAEAKGNIENMAEIWRQTMMKSTTSQFLQSHGKKAEELKMRNALQLNPMDADANKYFGEKIRLGNVQQQYEQMMEEYPESMGRVLMLYINCLVNKKPLQVFVDSGAQSTIMSSACADRLGLLHLVDTRFAGVAVGVGTGKILGRVHTADLNVNGYDLPCSLTVMDSEAGLGDKNMDCLFGLDMLKRHRCCIDLGKNVLRFTLGGGTTMEAPFLHEKDLITGKGGTMGFDAERENAEIEARMEKMETEEEEEEENAGKKKDGDGDGGEKK